MAIKNTQIQEVATNIFTAESGQQAITTMVFCNVTTATQTLSLFAVPYGENHGVTTQVLNNLVLAPGETFTMDTERFILEINESFIAQASQDNSITATISSVATT